MDQPRFRFDSALGRVRVRYGSTTAQGSARERYRDTGCYVPSDHADHYLVTLVGTIKVLDLRKEAVLDALGLDDRESTSHESSIWGLCHTLTDRVIDWWGDGVHGIAYRSRTTPETSANLAFFPNAPLRGRSRRLVSAGLLLDELVIAHGFTLGFDP